MSPDSESSPRVPWLPVNEGAQPAAPAPAPVEHLTPTKPTVPAWIQRDREPEPVEDEEGAVVAPVPPPLAQEVLPPLGVETTIDEPDEPTPSLWNSDPVHLLGESAVASAALSAAGAPTPLGGVPVVPADEAVTPPTFGDPAPLFTPRFEDVVADAGVADAGTADAGTADAGAAAFLAAEQARLAAQADLLDAGAAYTPRAFADESPTEVLPVSPYDHAPETVTAELPQTAPALVNPALINPIPTEALSEAPTAASAGPAPSTLLRAPGSTPEPDSQDAEPPRRKRRWWLWALIALVVVGAIAAAVVVLNRPEPIVVPGTTVTLPPAAPTIDPLPAPTGSDFQAAMPTEVGAYALVEATPLDPTDVALGMGRIADGVDLTYRSGADTMNVRALQYYNEEDASQMFTEFVGPGATTQPVEANGSVVGESAVVSSPEPGIVWRNGTSVFILTGPAAQLADFHAQFGL